MVQIERSIEANNLRHHILEWNPDATSDATVVILHGFLDLAWSFERVAVPDSYACRKGKAAQWGLH